jgi:very-short-patch-repair endonuclease
MDKLGSIVTEQRIDHTKLERAKQLRLEMTRAERILWQQVRGGRFFNLHFRRQQIIDGFIVDFYCHAAALVIEVDGSVHEQQREEDAERDAALALRGLRVLRFTNDDVAQRLDSVLGRLREACTDAIAQRAGT